MAAQRYKYWLLFALILGLPTAASAGTVPAFVPLGGVADAPTGFVDLCRRDFDLCRAGNQVVAARVIPATVPALKDARDPETGEAVETTSSAFAMPALVTAFLPAIADAGPPATAISGVSRPRILPAQPTVASDIATAKPFRMDPEVPVVEPPVVWDGGGFGTAEIVRTRRPERQLTTQASAQPRSLAGDGERLSFLRQINTEVNAQVVQLPDSVTAGVPELWQRPGNTGRPAGDCEDIAIEKRARLLAAGFAPERLFFAVVYRSGFGLHTVLVARLDHGDEVLDSAERQVQPWGRTRYVWLRAQTPGDPLHWARVALTARPT